MTGMTLRDIRRAVDALKSQPTIDPRCHIMPLYPWEERRYGADFRRMGYEVVVIGMIPTGDEGSTLGTPSAIKDDT